MLNVCNGEDSGERGGEPQKIDLKLTLTIFFNNICEFCKTSDIDAFQTRRSMILMRDDTESKLFSLKRDMHLKKYLLTYDCFRKSQNIILILSRYRYLFAS